MASAFEQATAVGRVGESARYAGTIETGWEIGGNANGGYMMAIAARAMADVTGRPPLSLTAHYLAHGRPGPCAVDVDVHRIGGRLATASARLSADGSDVLALVGTFGEQRPGGLSVIADGPPDVPPFDVCQRTAPPAPESGFGDHVEIRVRPEHLGFRDGKPHGVAEIEGWFTFADVDRDSYQLDAFGLLQASDSFAPVVFNVPGVAVMWAPTIELTVHVRGVPAPGPLRCRFTSRYVQDGMFEEDGELFDSTGRLVAQSRQLALLPRG